MLHSCMSMLWICSSTQPQATIVEIEFDYYVSSPRWLDVGICSFFIVYLLAHARILIVFVQKISNISSVTVN